MNIKRIEELKKIIKEKEENFEFNDYIFNYMDEDTLKEMEEVDLENYFDELNEDRTITDTDIIYYVNAIKYLQENDPSLHESLEIAEDLGYTTDKLNSEILASLLCSQNNLEDYGTFVQEVLKAFEVE